MKPLLTGLICLLGLSACSSQTLESMRSILDRPDPEPETIQSATASGVKSDPMRLDTIAYADAYCRGDGKAAVAATQKLVVANPKHPRAQLNYGLSLDLAGKGIASYRVLNNLAKSNHSMPAVLNCGDNFVYSGTVTEVAQRRLFRVKTSLTALGVILPLPAAEEHHKGNDVVYKLASLAPTNSPAVLLPPSPKMAAEPQEVSKPRQKPRKSRPMGKGRRFVHLGSYKSSKTLEKGWLTLRKRYGKILGGQPKAVSKVNLGRKKGQYLRLGVTVADARTAKSICRRLKAARQYCAIKPAGKT
jgi:hypothetical protein